MGWSRPCTDVAICLAFSRHVTASPAPEHHALLHAPNSKHKHLLWRGQPCVMCTPEIRMTEALTHRPSLEHSARWVHNPNPIMPPLIRDSCQNCTEAGSRAYYIP